MDMTAELAATIRGNVLTATDASYDEARRLWNGVIDKRPALIVRCLSAEDVVAAVGFARDHQLLLAVRGGGHNVAGNAVVDGGLVIDLSPMKRIRVDPERRTARVEPGVTLGELDGATQVFGLATPLGVVTRTGIAGLTLGGGMGWLRRKYGLSSDNLVSVDVVTAEAGCSPPVRRRTPTLLGHPRWRRQLRGGHVLRIPATSRRSRSDVLLRAIRGTGRRRCSEPRGLPDRSPLTTSAPTRRPRPRSLTTRRLPRLVDTGSSTSRCWSGTPRRPDEGEQAPTTVAVNSASPSRT